MEGLKVTICGRVYRNSKEVKQYKDRYGYMYLSHKNKKHKIHRLVAATFLGKSDKQVHHKDNNKTNNSIHNLQYVTHNMNDHYKWTINRKSSCKYIGVCVYKNKFRSQIQIDKVKKHLGFFNNPKIAHAFYMFNKEQYLL